MILFTEYPGSLIFLAGLLGLCVGSFLNVVIHRLPKMLEREWLAQCAELRGETPPALEHFSLLFPASRCPHCGHKIRPTENIPVISYLVLKGRCAGCHVPISIRYPAVEFITALFSAYAVWHFGFSVQSIGALIFLWTLIALSAIDFDTKLLPDSITLPFLWLGLIFNLENTYIDLHAAVIGAIVGYLVLWIVFWAFKLLTGKEGMGYGDFKLLAALGAWLGWKMLPVIILLSSLAGALIGIALIVFTKHGRNTPIPFGPYLALGGMVALFFGETLNSQYLKLFY